MSQEKSTNQIGNKIREVDERIIKMKQEREILSTFNSICNLKELVNETHKNLSIDLPLCEKIEIINDFRKNITSHLSSLSIKTEAERSRNYGSPIYDKYRGNQNHNNQSYNQSYNQSNNQSYNQSNNQANNQANNQSNNQVQNYRVRNLDGHKPERADKSLGRNISSSSAPSLWVSGFSDTTSQSDLHNLFLPLDQKLTQELVVHRGHYAFINFKDTSAAESAQDRCWNLNGEILETNVRYPRS